MGIFSEAPIQMDSDDPPLQTSFEALLCNTQAFFETCTAAVQECELPVIDLGILSHGSPDEVRRCKRDIALAASEWGFFQVVNHRIGGDLLSRMISEQVKAFRQPFDKKSKESLSDFPIESYRWGTPTATSLHQFSWSEAYHVPLSETSRVRDTNSMLRTTMEEYSRVVSEIAWVLVEALVEDLGGDVSYFETNCTSKTCYLRLNRYPLCPISSGGVFGLTPHTDSDFMTVVYQDHVGGLQLKKDGRWVTVKPNPETLVVNIGDLFEAWSNGLYKSVEHCVVANPNTERFSIAYFFCPSYDSVIESCTKPPIYRKFSFREFREKVQEDVRKTGTKVGLRRFLA
ncbi:Gibberellin 2-beta-dioxygenase 8 [Acorus calamus]|uniref:Gibberellin 2-beta-dioxygenase 8 n=1 Tax=Acorus calamus TaxID=4465 RepID=A0AAV9FJG6_ACOCL|nr:Gibberellin 2-beta-dioxygenase 8 [Acorus calamus]